MAGRRRATSLPSTPNRAEGIEPWPDLPDDQPVAEPAAAASPLRSVTDTPPTPEPPRRTPRRQPNRSEPSTTARIKQSLFDAINTVKADTSDTHSQWFAKALLATHEEVREHYRKLHEAEVGAPFAIPQRKARKPEKIPMAQYPIRLPADVRMFLTRLEQETDAPSRSELIEVIVTIRLRQLNQPV